MAGRRRRGPARRRSWPAWRRRGRAIGCSATAARTRRVAPALILVAETHIHRHEMAGWPLRAVTCDFYREQPEQAELTKSFAPLSKRGLRPVRPWMDATREALDQVRVTSRHAGRPQLERVLVQLMTLAGLQCGGPDARRPPPFRSRFGTCGTLPAPWSWTGMCRWRIFSARAWQRFLTSCGRLPGRRLSSSYASGRTGY